jgi:ABC-type spermidine/putrescine transport system permease subunit II
MADVGSRAAFLRIRELWAYAKYGPLRSLLAATGLMFIVAFQEFELPSLLSRPAWTVWLFDAQVGGLELSASLRATIFPLTIQCLVVVPLWYVLRHGRESAARNSDDLHVSRFSAWRDSFYLLAAFCLACLIPIALVGGETARGLAALAGNRSQLERLSRETLAGVSFALAAAWIALKLAEWESRARGPNSRLRKWIVPGLALPGLFGPLVMGLGLVSILQWPLLNVVYRTPVSLVLGLTLHLLPRALLLAALVRAVDLTSGRHAANLLGQSADRAQIRAADDLRWRLGGAARFGSLAILTYWGYLELTVAYLLGPTTIVSVPVLLYNQMHFGKNAVLSAMTFLAVVVPVALFMATAALRPVIRRSLWR